MLSPVAARISSSMRTRRCRSHGTLIWLTPRPKQSRPCDSSDRVKIGARVAVGQRVPRAGFCRIRSGGGFRSFGIFDLHSTQLNETPIFLKTKEEGKASKSRATLKKRARRRTACGMRAITVRYARAAWSGSAAPCSQSRSVPSGPFEIVVFHRNTA